VTVAEWLRSRTPPPPEALVVRVEAALGGPAAATDAAVAPERLLDAAVLLLEPLLAREDAGRECALDLLAADALVTYAFEAASVDAERLDERTRAAMERLAGLAPSSDDRVRARE
jgi:hypothetical protein